MSHINIERKLGELPVTKFETEVIEFKEVKKRFCYYIRWYSITAQKMMGNCPEIAQSCPEIAQRTFEFIKENPYATINEIHNALNISERTVKNHIALLRDKFIKRIGSDTKGHWEIIGQEK